MKTLFLYLFIIFFCLTGCKTTTQEHSLKLYGVLDSLFVNHQYFKLAEQFKNEKIHLSEKEKLIFDAKLNSVFNEKETSNTAIEQLFKKYENELADSLKIQLLEIEMNNSVLLYNYKKALENSEEILGFSSGLTEDEREDYENNKIIFNILKDVPKQKISISESSLNITKDLAGLSRIPIKINGTEHSAVFDTGANFSVITDSLALKTNLKILDGSFKVTAITGNKVDSHLAIADFLKLENVLVTNAVFLVFPEASLTFSEANYKIETIIGFPIIEALKEVRIIKDSIFYVPQNQSENAQKNLALNFLTPVVEVIENNRSLPFTFDTGANETMLYSPYYNDYKNEITETGKLDSIQIGGAGGSQFIKIYKLPFTGKISGNEFNLKNTTVSPDEKSEKDKKGIYGNLGKDVVKKFNTLTLNFEKMFLILN